MQTITDLLPDYVMCILPEYLIERLPYSFVEDKYCKAGKEFGVDVSLLPFGECNGFERRLDKWGFWEELYAQRGFRTISCEAFTECGGWDENIDHLLGQKREDTEQPVYHAELYRNNYLERIPPVIDLEKMKKDCKPQIGAFTVPSTSVLAEK